MGWGWTHLDAGTPGEESVRKVQVKGEVDPSEAMAWGWEREFIQQNL